AVDSIDLSDNLVLLSFLCEVSEAQVTVRQLKCAGDVLHTDPELRGLEAVYLHPEFRLVELQVYIHSLKDWVILRACKKFGKNLLQFLKVVILQYRLNRKATRARNLDGFFFRDKCPSLREPA